MKPGPLVGLLALLAGQAAAADVLRLAARESLSLAYPGAIAVFAVDPSTVETSHSGDAVVLRGRRAGQTLVTVVLSQGVETLTVQVTPPPPLLPSSALLVPPEGGFWENRYDTLGQRWDSRLGLNFSAGEHELRLRLDARHEARTWDGQRSVALPVASLAIESPQRTLVLLDDLVEQSRLTVDGVTLRGVHLHQGPLRMYAGVQSDQPFGDLLLPGSGDRAVGFSWRAPGAGLTLVPRAVWLPDSTSRVPGVVALGFESAATGSGLQWRGELGWSGGLGASLDVDYQERQRQLWLRASHRPMDFAALRLARPAGDNVEGAWTERLGEQTTVSVVGAATRLQLPAGRPMATSARAELRQQLSPQWSVSAAAGGGRYRGVASDETTRRTVSAGAAYDTPGFSASALLRHQQVAPGSGGYGMRLSTRATGGGWRGNLFVDAQQQAPTVALLLQDRPDIARALGDLGLAASDPEEVLRLLRENAALLQARGVTLGPLEIDPLRVQAGLDLSWRAGAHSPEFGVRVVSDQVPGLAGSRRQALATLYANWPLGRQAEFGLSYSQSYWRRAGGAATRQHSLQASLRVHFSALPLPGEGSRAITGIVMREEAGSDGASVPAEGVEVVLDGGRRTVTDRHGRFVFDRPGAGGHRVEAVLPPAGGVYFTTPSMQTLQPGAEGRFGLVYSAAVLTGTLRSDAGLPIAGATVRLRGPREASTVTDSSGAYRFAAPEGEAEVAVEPATLPPGYELGALRPQATRLARAQPASADFTVRAQRSVQGTVTGSEPATLEVPELGIETRPGADGRFVLRGLPAGRLTLVVRTRSGSTRHTIEVAPQPGTQTGLQLRAP